jgi:Glycosyltransferase family 87
MRRRGADTLGFPRAKYANAVVCVGMIAENPVVRAAMPEAEPKEKTRGALVSAATRVAAVAAVVFVLATAVRSGWKRAETDFPNYYTAAVLMRKGLPVREYYDWTWFQRQMNYAGVERQLGGYQPQTPLTALPLVGLAEFAPQTAKKIWLALNVCFLGAAIWLLAGVTGFRLEHVTLLAFLGFGSLYSNFLYGQYYVFLFFLLTGSFYCLDRGKFAANGLISGLAFGLKLYGGPLLLYFLIRRNWKAAAGFAAAVVGGVGLAIAMFGWGDLHYYATQILPRALEGEIIDPYNSGNGTLATLLRRLFVLEPELNPRPLWNAPAVFFFLRPFVSALILLITLMGLAGGRAGNERRDFSWFLIGILLLSANTASYTFILMLLPISLLLVDAELGERMFLVGAFFALCFPMRAGWSAVFPKLWVLLAVYFVTGWPYLRAMRRALVVAVVVVAAVLAAVDARRHALSYAAEPGQRFERAAVRKDAIFSGAPAVSTAGLFYQSIGQDRYVLRWLHDGVNEELVFEGHAFRPVALLAEGPIYFELVSRGGSMTMAFDAATRRAVRQDLPAPTSVPPLAEAAESVTSWDGRWIAFEKELNGPRRIWLRNVASGKERQLTGGNCNSGSPAWELDSRAIVFASDCGRGIGLPSLYRAKVGSE